MQVAERLGITQPSVSHALNRLRKVLGDPLFERIPRGLQPTPFADRIAEPIAYALATLQDSINFRDSFDPGTSTRTFTVSMTDIGEIYFLPQLIPYLAEHAPSVRLHTVRNSIGNLKEQMENGLVDLAVGLLPQLGPGFFQRRLFTQPYVCLMRREHPLAEGPFGLEEFQRAKHAVVVAQGTGHGQVEDLLSKSGAPRPIQLQLPHFVAVPYIIAAGELVVTVPEKLAERTAERFGLVIRPHPVALPEAPINLFWHRRYHHDAGNKWLRGLLVSMFAEHEAAQTVAEK
jgi:DNA-binding transcriptional LysR family regulator